MIIKILINSKTNFADIFSSKNSPLFEVTICFTNDGILDSDPTMVEHKESFESVFENMEHAIFKNQFLQFYMHDLNDLFFYHSTPFTRNTFDFIQKIVEGSQEYREAHQRIFETVQRDI